MESGGDLFAPKGGQQEALSLYIDGASRGNPGPAGVGVVFRDGGDRTLWEF